MNLRSLAPVFLAGALVMGAAGCGEQDDKGNLYPEKSESNFSPKRPSVDFKQKVDNLLITVSHNGNDGLAGDNHILAQWTFEEDPITLKKAQKLLQISRSVHTPESQMAATAMNNGNIVHTFTAK